MKTEKNILVAFILNFSFSVLEFAGGAWTKSIAIMSDAVHDAGDALSIGIAYFLERKSKRKPDDDFTYGYARYSAIGSVITCLILLFGSVFVIARSTLRLFSPVEINYSGMIVFAVFGVTVNTVAAFITKSGDSLNQKAVNLHMLEDVLGWLIVLLGAIAMRFTDIRIIDPLMSIGVSSFILFSTMKNLKESLDIFLERKPDGITIAEIKEHLLEIEGIEDIHHIHIWTFDGVNNCATMHVVTGENGESIKKKIREELAEHGIGHATLELENPGESCGEECCNVNEKEPELHSHHHHH